LADASTRINELTITVTSLTGDKRRMEADFQAMHADLDEAINARRAAEERADRLQLEVNRLADELRQEQDNFRNADALRKQLEVEIREITVRLEEAEAFAQKEGKRLIAKLQAKVMRNGCNRWRQNRFSLDILLVIVYHAGLYMTVDSSPKRSVTCNRSYALA
jgi:chromosome segregation ATPase